MKLVQMAIVQVVAGIKNDFFFHVDIREVQASKSIGKAFEHCYLHVCSRFIH
jgi:hypothetical protein